ncbi:hypothetical protein V5799_009484 [Amblyomma americanum]|uniref:Receptor ligand binding region domain-containing protein n=1 Tax=Amblyomma americanum TaxID=6943 RepID=A0AAQ4FAB7_AMBAM
MEVEDRLHMMCSGVLQVAAVMGPGGGVPVAQWLLVPLLLHVLASSLAPPVLCTEPTPSSLPLLPPTSASPASAPDTARTAGPPPNDPEQRPTDSAAQPTSSAARSGTNGSTEGNVLLKKDEAEASRQPVPAVTAGPAEVTETSSTSEPPRKPLVVAYLSNVAGTDNVRRQGLIVSGAMTYAVDMVNKERRIPGYEMRMLYRDTRGEMLQGTRSVLECWRNGAIAFFGPEDSCYVEAAVASSLNLPMISYFSSLQFHFFQFSSMQFHFLQFSSLQFHSLQFSSLQFHFLQFGSLQFHFPLVQFPPLQLLQVYFLCFSSL